MNVMFVLANIATTLGYFYVGAFVAPHFKLDSLTTRIAGIVFFVTCGLTHLHMAYDVWFYEGVFHTVSILALANHLVQAASVWIFVTGLHRQFVVGPRLRG